MEEILRQKKVLDMMITMHAILRDRYKFRALIVDIILFSFAVILNALVFVDYSFFENLGINKVTLQILIGIFSIGIFLLSVIVILVNWKEKSDQHANAGSQLSKLLNDCRYILQINEPAEKQKLLSTFNISYKEINDSIIKIPDNKFLSLKSKHLKKVALSKLLDENPQKSLWKLRLKLFFNGDVSK